MIAYFINGPCDRQHRVVNTDRRYIDAKVAGIVYRYEVMLGYGDRLIYAWNLSLWQVLERVMVAYCELEDEL
jgi:hypothetical protein